MNDTRPSTTEPPEGEGQPDLDLLERARTGDRGAYGELWDRYHGLATNVARPLARADAEDVVSDAFEAIWGQLQGGKGPQGNFRAYLLATVRNLAARSHRKHGRVLTGLELDDIPIDDESQRIEREEAARDIQLAFATLPERWRTVLWGIEVEHRPRTEVAQELGLSPNSTTQLLRRAKEGLREAWLAERFAGQTGTCGAHVAKDLPRYVRGGWSEDKRQQLQDHLAGCGPCRAREAELRQENAVFGSLIVLLPLVGGTILAGGGGGGTVAAATGLADRWKSRGEEIVFAARGNTKLPVALGVAGLLVLAPLLAGTLLSGGDPEAEGEAPPTQPISEGSPRSNHTLREDTGPERGAVSSEPAADAGDATATTGEWDADTVVPAPQPDADAQVAAIWPVIELYGGLDGAFPPSARGTADPAATLVLLVSGYELEVAVAADGTWQTDLYGLPLYAGMHSARARQTVQGEERLSAAANFALLLPRVAVGATELQSEVSVSVAGLPGAQVCWFDASGWSRQTTLDSGGSVTATFERSGGAGWQLNFRYCDASRVGPSGGIYIP